MTESTGPLRGVRIVEMAGLGPTPFGAMLLADLGADVVRIDRSYGAVNVGRLDRERGTFEMGAEVDMRTELLNRGRRSVAIDLKNPAGVELMLRLVDSADAFIEGYRPGTVERMGIGPDVCLARNPRLVYARLSGYGQDGPLRDVVGHDLNYIAQTGILSMIGRAGQPPTPPLALVGDFGGGGMTLALGILAALYEARTSERGQVVDVSIADSAALLATAFYGFTQTGEWSDERGTNVADSGAPFYDTYETADGGWLAIAAIEPPFFAEALAVLGLDPAAVPSQFDVKSWPRLRNHIADAVRARTRDEWRHAAQGRTACMNVVLTPAEAMVDPDNIARGTFVEVAGLAQPAPTPRFDQTPTAISGPPPLPGENSEAVLADWGMSASEIGQWRTQGAFRQS
jgi:alpha-methylacyl-CoA racemase